MNDSQYYQRKRKAEQALEPKDKQLKNILSHPLVLITAMFTVFLVSYVVIMSWALNSSQRECEANCGEYSSYLAGKVIVATCDEARR